MINDLVSNFVLTQAMANQTLNNSAVNSAAIDMSDGMTGAFQMSCDSAGSASLTLTLEYSADGSTWVADDGSTGNTIVDAAGVEITGGIVAAFPAIAFGTVVNPVGTNQFARMVVAETETIACDVSVIGAVGSKRFSEAE